MKHTAILLLLERVAFAMKGGKVYKNTWRK